jgi:hypothetical protein
MKIPYVVMLANKTSKRSGLCNISDKFENGMKTMALEMVAKANTVHVLDMRLGDPHPKLGASVRHHK